VKKTYLLVGLFIILVFFTRFYNLSNTAQFAEDEAGFLVRVHQIYVEKKITLVGQVNEFGTKVFSSSTVYMLLPFAIWGKFDPVSICYGAAFYGVLTVFVLLYLVKIVNVKLLPLAALLLLVFYPLVRMGRWAWNPNFIPLWLGMALVFYFKNKNWSYFFSGICLGLSVHQHYYAVFTSLAFIGLASVGQLIQKNILKPFLLSLAFVLALAPFVIFDLRHPPGIFLHGASSHVQALNLIHFFDNLFSYTFDTMKYYTQNSALAIVALFTTLALFLSDLSKQKKTLLFFVPVVLQVVFMSLIGSYFPHYFFSIIPFFLVWLFYKREKGNVFVYVISICLVVGGILSIQHQLKDSPVEPDLATAKAIDTILKKQITNNYLKNVNIATLASPDPVTQAEKYRSLLLVPDNLSVMTHDEYFRNDFLFVISTSPEGRVRSDPAAEMTNFRGGTLLGTWVAGDGSWRVYLFARG